MTSIERNVLAFAIFLSGFHIPLDIVDNYCHGIYFRREEDNKLYNPYASGFLNKLEYD